MINIMSRKYLSEISYIHKSYNFLLLIDVRMALLFDNYSEGQLQDVRKSCTHFPTLCFYIPRKLVKC